MDFRPITPDEFRDFARVWELAFNYDGKEEERDLEEKVFEFERSIAAVDGDTFVGTGGALSFDLTVPGGTMPVGGLTAIAVSPTHRRRGILTGIMRYHFDDVLGRGEPISVLRASESVIYGRYGYGVATRDASWRIDRVHTAFARPLEVDGEVRLVTPDEARSILPDVYERAGRSTPGFLTRKSNVWDFTFADLENWRDGFTANRFAVYEEGGEALGYLRYRAKGRWENNLPKNELLAAELISVSPKAEAALWHFAFSADLVETIRTQNRPTADHLHALLADPRRLATKQVDGMWVRLLDVPAALSGRRYRRSGRLVLEVADDFLPDAGGRFLLEGGPDGAECRRTDEEPDVVLDPVVLGARYLGSNSFELYHQVGRVHGDLKDIRRADEMFAWYVEPWCPHYF
jgi:predicted acetyltransferase